MIKKIRDFKNDEREKICEHYKALGNGCNPCPLHPYCKEVVFAIMGCGSGRNVNDLIIDVDDEILGVDSDK